MLTLLSRLPRQPRNPQGGYDIRKAQGGYDFHGWPELERLDSNLRETLSELNRCLFWYKSSPVIYQLGYHSPSLQFAEWFISKDTNERWERMAVWMLHRRNGEWMDRVRRCKACQTWFFAVVEHQTHCSVRCRQKRAATSDEFKVKRREYMREYRRREKAADENAKSIARRTR
jgi:hypothetical protein